MLHFEKMHSKSLYESVQNFIYTGGQNKLHQIKFHLNRKKINMTFKCAIQQDLCSQTFNKIFLDSPPKMVLGGRSNSEIGNYLFKYRRDNTYYCDNNTI